MITLYTEHISPRLDYATQVIFRYILKVENGITITSDLKTFKAAKGPKINYSTQAIDQSLQIVPSGFLAQSKIKPEFPGITDGAYSKAIFPTEGSIDFTYDPFSAVFYMVTRYEEYLPHETDQYDRFVPDKVFSFQHQFYLKPMAHYWAEELKDKLIAKFPGTEFPEKSFRTMATIDVDNGYAYRGKGSVRTLGAYVKDVLRLRYTSIVERTHVITGNKKDPFNYYKFQKKVCTTYGIPLRYFALCAKRGEHDHGLDITSISFKKLIRKLRVCGKVGIHPSYASNEKVEVLKNEIRVLSKILRKRVRHSRQHFIKLRFPHTYRNLITAGIKCDYSMGYPDHPGFRACIAEPYPFYDVEKEEITNLTIIPFQVMDTQYRDYKDMNAVAAVKAMKEVMEEVKKVSGLFVFVWHDRSFAPWPEFKGWKEAFVDLVKAASE